MLLKSVFIGFLSLSTLYADTLKECKNEADRISGCVEKIYHSNGRLWMEKPYKNGKKEGVERLYHGDMSIFVEMPFKNDKPEGIRRWYYENGNIGGEAIYKNGKQDGVIKMYDEGGNLQAEVSALNFILHGDTKLYTEDKKLFAIITKRYGETIFSKCLNGKVLTDKELSKNDIFKNPEKTINYLQEICLKESDSR
ncbi:toxin-antitoxin system YwqK family antitoxin [Helicobacter bilis]|uniref:toxin-antitoxin system YwqK family antitoxin n=1 Tax=Helicobacter bilis TaxID=37372 RepID=UPI00248E0B23|nr:toxin-antitoxin system YwqK family antitoxin [Helicobacter bilis]